MKKLLINKGKKLMNKRHKIETSLDTVRKMINFESNLPYIYQLNKEKRKIDFKLDKIYLKLDKYL